MYRGVLGYSFIEYSTQQIYTYGISLNTGYLSLADGFTDELRWLLAADDELGAKVVDVFGAAASCPIVWEGTNREVR